jgi:hypothetical protein
MKINNVIFGLYIILSFVLLFIAYIPLDIMQVENSLIYITNENNTVKPGEKLHYQYTYYKPFNITGQVVKSIRINNKYVISTVPQLGNLPSGTHDVVGFFEIPDTDFVLGKAEFIISIEYPLFGGMRVIYDKLESNTFTIKR